MRLKNKQIEITSNFDINNNRLINVSEPLNDNDAVTKKYLTDHPTNWGQLGGMLSSQTDLVTELSGKKNDFVENTAFNKNFGIIAGTVSEGNHTHSIISHTVSGNNIQVLEDSIVANIKLNLSNNKIVNLLTPTENYDAATKKYVDDQIGTIDQSAPIWGDLTGTLSNQTDLYGVLNSKANLSGATFTGSISATNLSGTNTGNETATTIGTLVNSLTEKTNPVDADFVGLMDSEATNIWKKLSWASIKSLLLTYFSSFFYRYKPAATGIPSTIGAGNISFDNGTDYYSGVTFTGNVTWNVTSLTNDKVISIDCIPSTYSITILGSGITFFGSINSSGVVQGLDTTKANNIMLWAQASNRVWVNVIKNQA